MDNQTNISSPFGRRGHLARQNKTFPLEISKANFVANRQTAIYLAQKYYNTLGKKEFVHSETGIRTLKDEFDKVALHNQGDLDQIKLALAK